MTEIQPVKNEEFWYEPTEDSMYRVHMKINDVTASCTVSSMHLIEEKRAQLRGACLRNVDS
jgi:hypothetical protein|tara:strand:+ start:826 stop:1008 length:183 start_codon:yes stop_codon:yes gene_type:complete